jgi:putative ABC transport system permease protein
VILSDFINTQITDVSIIPFLPYVVIVQIIVSVLIPVLSSLLPVLRGTEKTVKQALSGNLVSTEVENSKFDRWIESLPGINAVNKISIRNTFRRKGRLFTTIFALALAGAIFIAVFNTQGSLNKQMEDSADLMGVDINIQFNKTYNEKKVEETLMSLPAITYAEAWGTDIAYFQTSIQEESVSILAPQKDSLTIHPTLTSGRWFVDEDEYAIVVNKAFLDRSDDIQLGSQITLKLNGEEKQWTIIGTTHVMGDDSLEAYISKDMWEKETHTSNSSIAYRIILADHSLDNQLSLEKIIYDWLEAQGYYVSSVISVQKIVNNTISMLDIVIFVLLILAILTAFVGSIGMTGTLSMNILERTSEIGILRAIGGNNQIIRKLVIIEGIIIGCISYFFSVVLSFPVTLVLKSLVLMSIFGTAGKFIISWQGFVIWLILVLVFSIFASVVPARDATNLTIREVLAYE